VGVHRKSDVHILTHGSGLGAAFHSYLLSGRAGTFVGWVAIIVQMLALAAQVFSLCQLLDVLRSRSASSVDVGCVGVPIALGRHCHVS
jgi:hypothetical protein